MPARGIPVLIYHAIETANHTDFPMNIGVSVEHFKQQVEWLHKEGYKSVNKKDLDDVVLHGRRLKGKNVVITFDDGYHSIYKHAFPILSRYGFTATIFVSTSFVGHTYDAPDFYFIKHDPALTWDELRALRENGWNIQSHGYTHSRLKGMPEDELIKEITLSKKLLHQHLGIVADEFAYPYGLYSNAVIQHLKTAGYRYAYSVHSGKLRPALRKYRLPRIFVLNTDSLELFKTKVETGYKSPADARRSRLRDLIYAHPALKDLLEEFTPRLGIGNR